MKNKILSFLKSHWAKTLALFFFVLLLGAYANIFAIGSPYNPGSTLNPECAPGEENCYIDFNNGGGVSSPWLTSTGGIYYDDGNVRVGNDGSINTEISGGIVFSNKTIDTFQYENQIDVIPAVTTDNYGNPVIVYFLSEYSGGGIPLLPNLKFVNEAYASGYSSLILIHCQDSSCNTYDEINVTEDYYSSLYIGSGSKPSIKIDSNNKVHLSFFTDMYIPTVVYTVCGNGSCTSTDYDSWGSIEPISYLNGNGNISLLLDINDNPYILYDLYNNSSGANEVLIAKYTGTGIENSCDFGGINSNWSCQTVLSSNENGEYYLDQGSIGDSIEINDSGNIVFIASYYDYNSGKYITYNECIDSQCSSVSSSIIDLIGDRGNASSLSINKDGIPYVAYIVGPEQILIPKNNLLNKFGLINTASASISDAYNIFIAYLNPGNGSGCSETSDWSCRQITDVYEYSDYEGYHYLGLEIGEDNLPQISATKYTERGGENFYLDYIKCLDKECFNVSISTVLQEDPNNVSYAWNLASSLSISDSGNTYLSYINHDDYTLNLLKIGQADSVAFNIDNSLYSGGDLGVSGNLFVDGSIATSGGLYISSDEPNNTNNALYNIGGELYWNGGVINNNIVNSDLSLKSLYLNNNIPNNTDNSLYNNDGDLYWNGSPINTFLGSVYKIGTEVWIGAAGQYNSSSNNTIFIGTHAGQNATNAYDSIFMGRGSGTYSLNANNSNFLGYQSGSYNNSGDVSHSNFFGNEAGRSAMNSNNSNFFGQKAGYRATTAYNSNFFGNYAGYNPGAFGSSFNAYNSNFFGQQAGYSASSAFNSNFLGYNAGQSATSASNSNFLGYQSGYNASSASYSNFLGYQSGYLAQNAANSIFLGRQSGYNDGVNNTATFNDTTTFANTSILIGHKTGTGNFSNSIAIGAYATNTATNQFMIGSTNRPINTTVWKGTNVTLTLDTATGLSTPSDQRLKTNIHMLNTNEDYMDYASSTRESYTEDEISEMTTLEKVLKITPVRYDWREDPSNEYIFEQDITPENIGFIAQDLINFFPEVVSIGHDENEYLGVNYANMTPILVEAIKEMNLKVESINTFEDKEGNLIENSWRDSFIAWFENIENGIRDLWADRIHAKNELCIGEGTDEVCLNSQELREVKDFIGFVNPKDEDVSSGSTGTGE